MLSRSFELACSIGFPVISKYRALGVKDVVASGTVMTNSRTNNCVPASMTHVGISISERIEKED